MYQNQYKDLETFGRAGNYVGGFCRWWYTPIENIVAFPAVDPITQWLTAEPTLAADATWYGPVKVPETHMGWEEDMQRAKPGIYYKNKVVGYVPGMSAGMHINIDNHAAHKFCIVVKARSGGNFYILGDDQEGLDPDFNTATGEGSTQTPGTKIAFTGESLNKALILPSFQGVESTINNTDLMEIISFTNANTIPIVYNTTRRNKFGQLPSIEVWITGSPNFQVWPEILADALPSPNNFTVNIAGPASGYIKLYS